MTHEERFEARETLLKARNDALKLWVRASVLAMLCVPAMFLHVTFFCPMIGFFVIACMGATSTADAMHEIDVFDNDEKKKRFESET